MVQGSLKDTTVCVVGLGYVGYPLADAFSRHLNTIGYDLDTKKIARINAKSMIPFARLHCNLSCKKIDIMPEDE